MKTQEELLNIISTNTALISKAFEEAGDELSYDKITSLTGTPKEKADALQALINERDSAKTEHEAGVVKLAELAEQKKKNAEIEKTIKTPVNRMPLNNGVTDKVSMSGDDDYTKSFALPRSATRSGTIKYCKNEKEAYAVGMWVISKFTDAGTDENTRAKQFVNDNLTFKALAGQSNAFGGALVPQEFLATLIDLRENYGVYSKYAKHVPMNSDTLLVPRRNAHTAAYWVTENTAPTTSAPTFNNVQLITKKLASEIAIPFELVEDAAINIGEWVMQDFAWNFARAIDLAAFIGDGTATYGNVVGYVNKLKNLGTFANSSGLVTATGTGYGTNYNSIVLTDFEAVQGRLLTEAWNDAKWYMSNFVYNNVAKKLALAAGGVTGSEVVNGVNTFRFLGCEVVITQALPSTSAINQVCALFGSIPMSSMMGDRRMFNVKTSDQAGTLWQNDQLGIKATQRLDINVHDVGNNNSDHTLWEMSPIVGLITAAS